VSSGQFLEMWNLCSPLSHPPDSVNEKEPPFKKKTHMVYKLIDLKSTGFEVGIKVMCLSV
jgi:hypothetical protein